MELYTIVIAILLSLYAVFDGGVQWQKMKSETEKKLGKWLGVGVTGLLGFWGLFIFIKGVTV